MSKPVSGSEVLYSDFFKSVVGLKQVEVISLLLFSLFIEIDRYIDFGKVFKYTGSFVLNQETLVGKGLKALNCLFYNIKKYSLSPKVMWQLFDAFVGSILNYSCEI